MKTWERRVVVAALFATSLLVPLAATAFKLRIVSGLAGAQDDKSKVLMALSPAEADQVARRDLLSVLHSAGKFTPDNSRRVAGMTFLTPPYLENTYPSICREDRVTLTYDEVAKYDAAGKYVREERQPVGVEAQALFHVDELPVRDFDERGGQNPRCDATHPGRKASWFAAPDLSDALRAANMFRMAEDEVRAASLTPAPCEPGYGISCREWVLSLDDTSKIAAIDTCPATEKDGVCYVISFGSGEELTILGTIPGGSSPPRITPTAITSIQVDRVVTVSE